MKEISSSLNQYLESLLNQTVSAAETYLRRIPLNSVTESWFLRNIDIKTKKIHQIVKRFGDLVLALILLCITLPFWPLIMLLIRGSGCW
ncbi:hypothetical protein AGMMS50267_13050 [Spirochaetia bacterium]|nr:hypothetical protein AGMMS50267_13050 [Spirochaetia bacterium]